ncbi:MAG: amino acid adenylation domain-containing protein, partial [Candidatus Xenobia bacterium]
MGNPAPVLVVSPDLATLIDRQIARTPQRVAVRYQEATLTFADLDARARDVERRLAAADLGPGRRVGMLLPRSEWLPVAMLAIVRSGATLVALEPSYPAPRLLAMIEEAELDAILVDAPDSLPVTLPRVLLQDGPQAERHPGKVDADAWCYIMFTSGSTGRPKAVPITQRGALNFLTACAEVPGMSEGDVVLSLANATFDPVMVEVVLPLTVGATSVIVPRDVAADGARLCEVLAEVQPTILSATPATFTMLMDAGWQHQGPLKIYCGGEMMTPALADALLARATEVWNVYGPTETAVLCACHRVRPGEHPVPIGRAMPGYELLLLDEQGRELPPGEVGELLIGGPGVSPGYLKRPDLNAQSFLQHGGRRLYRSGDMARRREDGCYLLLGRRDAQLKVRGCRVEPAEVEAVLDGLPGVSRSTVIMREGRLVAYLAVPQPPTPTDEELRAWCASRLPEYMLPSAFVALPSLPITANGKVDRAALPGLTGRGETARDPVEAQLGAVWEEVLGVSRPGIDQTFAELGGTSLLAVRLVVRAEQVFGQRVAVADLMQAPTIRRMAELLRQPAREPAPGVPAHSLADAELESLYRRSNLTRRQLYIWLAASLQAGPGEHHVASLFMIEGEVQPARLRAALGMLVESQEALRTVVRLQQGVPHQVVLPHLSLPLDVVDLSETPHELEAWAQERAVRPFQPDRRLV